MSYKLVIVESPTKVISIGRHLKDGYKIASSMGHIRDLPPSGGMHIDIANDFKPNYQINTDKKKLVAELKKLAKDASEIIMASDEDREGEAIAWHLCQILNLDPQTTKRIVFHEITAEALQTAVEQPRFIDLNLVNAQQARRIVDRIVGFELSPVLWRKIQKGLSAGRVQSVAMRLIYDREEEIKNFQTEVECQASATFKIRDQNMVADLKNKLPDLEAGREFLETCRRSQHFTVSDIAIKESSKNPSPPFKTSTLQQEAAQKLGFSIQRTMMSAQKLYEGGFITYMRTDSLNLSRQALKAAENYVKSNFGAQYYRQKQYQTKSQSAQEAHEAIRPSDFTVQNISKLDQQADKLYQLIWQRTLASQMAPALIDKTNITIAVEKSDYILLASGQILRFDGFLKVAREKLNDVLLPEIAVGDNLELTTVQMIEKFSKPPARFEEASLVKKLEDLGIGRPSTYAPTVNTILERGYVIKGDVDAKSRRCRGLLLENAQIRDYESEDQWGGATNKLLPTDLAKLVTPFLKKHFEEIMDYGFTSKLEADFDKIARGQLDWIEHLRGFYDNFHPTVETAQEIPKSEVAKMRELGLDPNDQKMIYARLGRYGPMLQKGLAEDSQDKPSFAALPADISFEDITLEEALELFKLPRLLGQTLGGEDVQAKRGPYGPYLEVGDKVLRVPFKEEDPLTIRLEEALKLIDAKEEEERKKIIADFGDLKILNGRYGPYITDGVKNGRIPKKDEKGQAINPEKISLEQATRWLVETGKAPRAARRKARK